MLFSEFTLVSVTKRGDSKSFSKRHTIDAAFTEKHPATYVVVCVLQLTIMYQSPPQVLDSLCSLFPLVP